MAINNVGSFTKRAVITHRTDLTDNTFFVGIKGGGAGLDLIVNKVSGDGLVNTYDVTLTVSFDSAIAVANMKLNVQSEEISSYSGARSNSESLTRRISSLSFFRRRVSSPNTTKPIIAVARTIAIATKTLIFPT